MEAIWYSNGSPFCLRVVQGAGRSHSQRSCTLKPRLQQLWRSERSIGERRGPQIGGPGAIAGEQEPLSIWRPADHLILPMMVDVKLAAAIDG